MLIRFTLANWMSFREETTFNMAATKEKQHNTRVPKVGKYPIKILPFAAIYGSNASGKTNFFKGINFARNFIVRGSTPGSYLAMEPFRLDADSMRKPGKFGFEILIDDIIYEYFFVANKECVFEEKLVEINSNSEKTLFHRQNGKANFDSTLKNNERLKFAFIGTRDNQLFLTNSVFQNIDKFKHVYEWFKNSLVLIAPDSRFEPFEHYINESHQLYGPINHMLESLDTGITQLAGKEIDFEAMPIPEPFKTRIKEEMKDGMTFRIQSHPKNERHIVKRQNGVLKAFKLYTYHKNSFGEMIPFEMENESDGTQRIIDLLPAFIDVSQSNCAKTYIIDEIDRSLHTILTRKLVESYLHTCSPKSRNQLLITTHDVLLMDQKIIRRDEMWIAERNENGCSMLIPFSDFDDIRYDKDLRKSYLQGRLGGIPKILFDFELSGSNGEQIING
ncbi:MAG: ATP-binding protein [Candidatus Riflebacteria bacterium]